MTIILQTLIALIAIFIIFSIANSLLIEAIVVWRKRRFIELEDSIHRLFATDMDTAAAKTKPGKVESQFGKDFFEHSFIRKLAQGEGRSRLSWIPSDVFAETFIDMVITKGKENGRDPVSAGEVLETFQKGVDQLPDSIQPAVRQLLRFVHDENTERLKALKFRIGAWFDAYMQRITEQYKRKSKRWLFIGGLVLAGALNLDMIFLSDALYHQDDVRLSYYALGRELNKGEARIDSQKIITYISQNLESLDANGLLQAVAGSITTGEPGSARLGQPGLPIGWGDAREKMYAGLGSTCAWQIVWKVLGIIAMAGVLSFGAPFWFDVLRKLIRFDKTVRS